MHDGRVQRIAEARARDQLGFRTLHEEQRRAISASVQGRDVLVVMPTGSGKSAIYQLTGELRDGPTIVVSPLLALQHDQLGNIGESGLSRAAALNSLLRAREFRRTLEAVARGEIEFVFVAPEQLTKRDVLEPLRAARPSLFVVDEAHCISAWGHDFRPDYLQLGSVATNVGRPPILALTATAAPPVRAEVIDRLGLRDPLVVAGSFDRPEIDLRVERFTQARAKRDALVSDVATRRGTGVVYVGTRKATTTLTAALHDQNIKAAAYHGALDRAARTRVHEQFLDGTVRVVVATNAFGMGIDKPDVRFVFHFDVPGSLDAYYQEIGRAGRDGDDSEAILYYDGDTRLQRFFAGGAIDRTSFARVLAALRTTTMPASTTRVAQAAEMPRRRAAATIDCLARVGAIERDGRGRITKVDGANEPDGIEAAVEAEQMRRRFEQSRLEMMRAYAETTWCRRALLLGYYGEPFTPPCGRCDNCRTGLVAAPDGPPPFAVGERVVHREWGPGTVMVTEPDRVVVLFAAVGYRTLSIPLVRDRNLLARAS